MIAELPALEPPSASVARVAHDHRMGFGGSMAPGLVDDLIAQPPAQTQWT
jgi:hypothetical protein